MSRIATLASYTLICGLASCGGGSGNTDPVTVGMSVSPVADISIAHITGTYGDGLSGALRDEWVTHRGQTVNGNDVTFDEGTLDDTTAATIWGQIQAEAPAAVVGIGFGVDANALVRAWA